MARDGEGAFKDAQPSFIYHFINSIMYSINIRMGHIVMLALTVFVIVGMTINLIVLQWLPF